ncbi:CD40 ligand [Pundamilia nyererei]|uniref:Tumor necrosis factor ligand superfamily member 6-like n=1 Tax=Pundamilia nyererei TaxID=303518 RepID=A0A3B4G3Y9_9CICH|nr:PREDICTED: tumor necrosis factor ligand superfamily member 6-like [Pundamilia nyererei]
MINTYQTSLAPPPVPPRSRSQPVLIPASLPSQGHNKVLVRFLVGVVALHLLLSLAGFFYLYYHEHMEKHFSAEDRDGLPSSQKQEMDKQDTFYKALARMAVKRAEGKKTPGCLQWDTMHSVLRGINYYEQIWLTIPETGFYYVYSRVTFSKGDSTIPLASKVKLRKNEADKSEDVMKAYCYLESTKNPHMCTAAQGDLILLEKGNQLSLWVQDLSLVDYEEGATSFGIYKL